MRGLLFEGHLLTYNPKYHVTKWVPVCGMAGDLSPVKDSSAQELSNIMLLDMPEDVPQMEQFGEQCMEPTPVTVPCIKTSTLEEEMEQECVSAEGDTDVHHVECHAESQPISLDTTEVAT